MTKNVSQANELKGTRDTTNDIMGRQFNSIKKMIAKLRKYELLSGFTSVCMAEQNRINKKFAILPVCKNK